MEKCENCKYWGKYETSNANMGSCRKSPPSIIDGKTKFPSVRGQEWCGGWVKKAEITEENVV